LRLALSFLLLGQNRLHHIAGLGDVRQVDFGTILLLGARTTRGSRPAAALQMHTHLFRLVVFNGAGMGLALGQTQLP
jgi:hypothetical protein